MTPVFRWVAGPVLSLAVALPAVADEPLQVRNRLTSGWVYEYAPSAKDSGLEAMIGEWLRADLLKRDALSMELRVSARFAISLLDYDYFDRSRVRELGLHLDHTKWEMDIGRFAPEGGSVRLVDGVQALAEVAPGLRLGGWAGFGADPYTTAPALRYGGGPTMTWSHKQAEASLFGEVLATPDGLDRLSAVVRSRVEFGRMAELYGWLDVQAGGEAGFRLADATVLARLDPRSDVRIDLGYDAWSSMAYLVSEDRDPSITRFSERSAALSGDVWVAQDTLDTSVYHMASGSARWQPVVGPEGFTRLRLRAHGRYRYHLQEDRRYANAGLEVGAIGLAGGQVDLGVGQAYYDWGGTIGTETSGWVWAELDRRGRFAVDSTVNLYLEPLVGGPEWAPTLYADVFFDWLAPKEGLSMSLGYSFSNSMDVDRWDSWHGAMLRVAWRMDNRPRSDRSAP